MNDDLLLKNGSTYTNSGSKYLQDFASDWRFVNYEFVSFTLMNSYIIHVLCIKNTREIGGLAPSIYQFCLRTYLQLIF